MPKHFAALTTKPDHWSGASAKFFVKPADSVLFK